MQQCVSLISVLLELIPREVVYSVLRLQLPQFAVACVIGVAGICSLWVAALKMRDGLFLSTGIISLLYALRLFIQNELVRDAFAAPGTGYLPVQFALTFAINVPFAFFALELFGRGWKHSIQIWLWLCIAFAAIAIPLTLATNSFDFPGRVNNWLVISGTILLLRMSPTREGKGIHSPLRCSGRFCCLPHSLCWKTTDSPFTASELSLWASSSYWPGSGRWPSGVRWLHTES